jgi:hypothetical protein
MHERDQEYKLLFENLKERNHFEQSDLSGSIILKEIVRKEAGCIWLRKRISGEFL